MNAGVISLVAGSLLAAGIGASLVAGRLRVPGLLLFLALGMAVGHHGLRLVDLTDVGVARTIGTVALALILFEGGLDAGLAAIRPVLAPAVSLALVGTILTALITGGAAHAITGDTLLGGLLLGAIVASTDSAAIFSVLRGSTLKRRLAMTLEVESGLNDPVGILLVLGFINWIQKPGYGIADMALLLARQLGIGAVVGIAAGRLSGAVFERLRLSSSGLYPVLSLATVGLAFGIADRLGGSGFLAVYVAGLVLANAAIPARTTVREFHDGLGWVSQIVLFVTLGLLVVPRTLGTVAPEGIAIAAVLMLVARPLATLVATRVGRFTLPEALLIGGAGLRGAVPIVLATFPLIRHVPGASRDFHIVFFIVLASTLLQGLSFEPLARLLGQTTDEPALSRPLIEVGMIRRLGAEVVEYPVGVDDAIAGRLVNELELPREALVSVIVRGDEALLPRGSTSIESRDRLHILVRQRARRDVERLFERWRAGPIGEPSLPPARHRGRAPVFSVRPWQAADGDPGDPLRVGELAVVRRLRTRRGAAGSLVQLEDARYAVTGGGVVAIGGSRQVFRYCRDRIGRATSDEERAWWMELAGVLSRHAVR